MKTFWLTTCFTFGILQSLLAWASPADWYLSIEKKASTAPIFSSLARLRYTDENILVITTLSSESPLAGRLEFNQCHYPVDLTPFTQHLLIRTNQLIKKGLRSSLPDNHAKNIMMELNPEDESSFVGALVSLLNEKLTHEIIIHNSDGTLFCQDSHDDAVLALSNHKIHPKDIFLLKEDSQERISLYDWAWQQIDQQWRDVEMNHGEYEPHRTIQHLVDWIQKQGIYEPPCAETRTNLNPMALDRPMASALDRLEKRR